MTNEQILKKVIEKAVDNGFKYAPYLSSDGVHAIIFEIPEIDIYRHLIFSHDFAKAFWGKEPILMDLMCKSCYCWQYHLQRMVLEKEPLKYLKEFL